MDDFVDIWVKIIKEDQKNQREGYMSCFGEMEDNDYEILVIPE